MTEHDPGHSPFCGLSPSKGTFLPFSFPADKLLSPGVALVAGEELRVSDGDEQSRGDWVYEEEGQNMNQGVSTFQHGLGL